MQLAGGLHGLVLGNQGKEWGGGGNLPPGGAHVAQEHPLGEERGGVGEGRVLAARAGQDHAAPLLLPRSDMVRIKCIPLADFLSISLSQWQTI